MSLLWQYLHGTVTQVEIRRNRFLHCPLTQWAGIKNQAFQQHLRKLNSKIFTWRSEIPIIMNKYSHHPPGPAVCEYRSLTFNILEVLVQLGLSHLQIGMFHTQVPAVLLHFINNLETTFPASRLSINLTESHWPAFWKENLLILNTNNNLCNSRHTKKEVSCHPSVKLSSAFYRSKTAM